MPHRTPGRSTLAIHGDQTARAVREPVSPPIYQSSTFVSPFGAQDEVLYTRYGNNPNQKPARRTWATPRQCVARVHRASPCCFIFTAQDGLHMRTLR